MEILEEDLQHQTTNIIKHLRSVGGIFGDASITTEDIIYRSVSDGLPDIASYCKKYKIHMTELDTIKLCVFALPYLRKNDPSMNIERYITSVFLLLQNAYEVKIDFDSMKNTIIVCNNLFYNDPSEVLVIYGYIKGFQECLQYVDTST